MMRKMYQMISSHCSQNILIEETISYITEQICVNKKLTLICSKLIFSRLLIKLATKCTLSSLTDSSNKWMIALWENHYLLLLVTFTWSIWKMIL